MLLNVEGVRTFYGTFEALRGVSLDVNAGEVVTILGSNGAGKSTLLRTISGLIRSRSGNIHYEGERINGVTPEVIVKLGISHCPEGRMLFPEMPVYKNLELGAYVRRKDRSLVEKMKQEVYELFPIIDERKKQTAGTLSGGEQQMLAVGRALMSGPKLLMLDEPSLGLAPLVVMNIMDALVRIKERGTAILLVEQNAAESLRIAGHGYVLETGTVVLSGKGEDLMSDEKVRQSYLGA
ncbi:MAG: livF [Deltaproteobacteria bacterium]|jgi:branched-chain amino acid transport system ATP-binding protein|nr:livF [Deltaproteobacteria bacterium]